MCFGDDYLRYTLQIKTLKNLIKNLQKTLLIKIAEEALLLTFAACFPFKL